MSIAETAVWSAMLGGLLTLVGLSLADALVGRNIGAVRNLLFVLITGASCVVITGLPEVFFPALPDRLTMVLKAGLGPIAGAMALHGPHHSAKKSTSTGSVDFKTSLSKSASDTDNVAPGI